MSSKLIKIMALIFCLCITSEGALSVQRNDNAGVQLPRKQTDDLIKKVLEAQFMDAVTRIDEYVKFLYQLNTKLRVLSVQLSASDDNFTKIESVLEQHVKACQLDVRHYLKSHGESLRKHPLKTLAETVADALSMVRLGHIDEPSLMKAILDRLGPRFATLYRIAEENVAMLQIEIRAHLADLSQQLLASAAVHLTTKPSARFHRLQSIILQIIHHPSSGVNIAV